MSESPSARPRAAAVPAGPERRRAGPRRDQPTSPAASTIAGNGTPKAKIATNAAAATARAGPLPSARRPIRTTACSTMASTAAFSPKNSASTSPPSPKAT